tara:strand:+ start:53 stop:460 length:408 start_codon:yes stop_codon:yes gene_type:complete
MTKLKNKKINTRSGNMIDNTMREAERLGTVGPIVKVTWYDAASTFKTYRINAEDPKEHLTICETVGEMVAQDDTATVLVMHGSQCDGADIFAIPTDWTQKIEVLKQTPDWYEKETQRLKDGGEPDFNAEREIIKG